ncbi:Jouberin [Phytophthora boehmeriae]|uniref:Jouberin n=1 Tax=Phytophthora boehmeriae TaxID=109152 RepID=A0A8T1WAC3_9STRA|nr:Jouberin [Phytophthora boehmeriae]
MNSFVLPHENDSAAQGVQKIHAATDTCGLRWHHFPYFVYCATFLPRSNGDIVLTGASDGCLRFRKESSIPKGYPEFGILSVSSVAVNSICAEPNGERIFCGDARGDVTVWRRVPSQPAVDASISSCYELVKTIRTGQSNITSLQLHPRKAHLLVHTQPNAIFQYELRSYLLLNKSYAGVVCETLLVKSVFSPDGKLVISGSEDGVPRLFTSLHGRQLNRSVWGTHFFHDCPVLDVSWSPTTHMAAFCSYGGNHPIVVLAAYRDDKEAVFIDNIVASTTTDVQQLAVDAFRGANQNEALKGEHAQRVQRALERRQQRLQTKLTLETEVNREQAASVAG